MRESTASQTIEPTPWATDTRRINRFPTAGKPPRGFESKQDRVKSPGSDAAALMNVCAGEFLPWALEKGLEYLQGLKGKADVSFTHTCKST